MGSTKGSRTHSTRCAWAHPHENPKHRWEATPGQRAASRGHTGYTQDHYRQWKSNKQRDPDDPQRHTHTRRRNRLMCGAILALQDVRTVARGVVDTDQHLCGHMGGPVARAWTQRRLGIPTHLGFAWHGYGLADHLQRAVHRDDRSTGGCASNRHVNRGQGGCETGGGGRETGGGGLRNQYANVNPTITCRVTQNCLRPTHVRPHRRCSFTPPA